MHWKYAPSEAKTSAPPKNPKAGMYIPMDTYRLELIQRGTTVRVSRVTRTRCYSQYLGRR